MLSTGKNFMQSYATMLLWIETLFYLFCIYFGLLDQFNVDSGILKSHTLIAFCDILF